MNIIVFLLINVIWTNRKGEKKYFLLLVEIRLFIKKVKLFLMRFLFCFCKSVLREEYITGV